MKAKMILLYYPFPSQKNYLHYCYCITFPLNTIHMSRMWRDSALQRTANRRSSCVCECVSVCMCVYDEWHRLAMYINKFVLFRWKFCVFSVCGHVNYVYLFTNVDVLGICLAVWKAQIVRKKGDEVQANVFARTHIRIFTAYIWVYSIVHAVWLPTSHTWSPFRCYYFQRKSLQFRFAMMSIAFF